jgi:hypothetical protein
MRLTLETRRAIAQALAKRCNIDLPCPVDGVCPFDMDCTEVKPWQWEKSLGNVQCKKVKRSGDNADHA